MEERNLTVIGSYSTREEALTVVEQLRDKGYDRDDIVIYTTDEAAKSFGFSGLSGIDVETDVNDTEGVQEDRSLWERIKDAFSTNTYDEYTSNEEGTERSAVNDPLYQYRDDIADGKIVITVKNYRGAPMSASEINTDKSAEVSTNNIDYGTNDDTTDDTIQLKEEQLDINTHDVTTGEVDIHKHVVNDTKTIEVPVKREEIVIERKPVNNEMNQQVSNDSLEDETITIPIKEEQIDVNKHTIVREEVDIHKKEHEDVKQVSEQVSREELDIDTKGDIQIEDTKEKTQNPDNHL